MALRAERTDERVEAASHALRLVGTSEHVPTRKACLELAKLEQRSRAKLGVFCAAVLASAFGAAVLTVLLAR